MAKVKDLIDCRLDYYFQTSREMLWHLVGKTDEFFKKDDLANKTKEELIDFIVELYDNMWNQLNNSEQ